MAKTEIITCVFWDPSINNTVDAPVKVGTSHGPRMMELRHTCQDHCRDKGYPGWAQPSDVDLTKPWLIFRMEGRMAHYVKHAPTVDAAAMWLVHEHGA